MADCQCETTISETCNYCANIKVTHKTIDHKIYPSDLNPEPPSPNFNGPRLQAVSVRHSSGRSDEDDADDSATNFFSPYSLDTSDLDSSSVSTKRDFNSFTSLNSSPSDSPSKIQEQQHISALKSHDHSQSYDDFSIFQQQCDNSSHSHKPLDFETNDLIWFPPPSHDQNDDDTNFFSYNDDDDDDETGEIVLSSSEPLKTVVQGHFRALVSQLLQSEFNSMEKWVDIVTSLAWQAAHYVKPDTSRGGSMDPGDYVKIKCIASGNPSESVFVKGVVCTKNIKHKRMTSQYKNARVLILAGALEYQRSRDHHLSSIETLLQQEMDDLKMIVSRIEAHRPNVLLVEKSVSSYAQEYLLAKEISLVLNMKRPLLDRISRCSGAPITPSISHISTTRVGHCEVFKLEKVVEEHENEISNKKPSKTLMFFQGCPRRLGCTVLLKGSSREELKKLKHVVQYAIFAAYHLSLETSFLADEGASLPKMTKMPSPPQSEVANSMELITKHEHDDESRSFFEHKDEEMVSDLLLQNDGSDKDAERAEVIEGCDEYYSVTDNNNNNNNNSNSQSILVSFSSHCVVNGSVCERSRLLRIKFYGCFDKPLGRYLQDDLFDQTYLCESCKEPCESHVKCYTHQQGNLTINVRRLQSLKLPGGKDGKIWMWHRCLRCPHVDGVLPANHRAVMSDAAWGLSFGKFLELSFSNHATANRVAICGHSLQRDCLRFYGMGDMVAFFRYSPIDILSVHLPPSVLQFGDHFQDWLKKEVSELLSKIEGLYEEILDVLNGIESKSTSFENDVPDSDELSNHVMELKDQLSKERQDYIEILQSGGEEAMDVFEVNRLRHSLVINLHFWDRRIGSLNLYGRSSNLKPTSPDSKSWRSDSIPEDTIYHASESELNQDSDSDSLSMSFDLCKRHEELQTDVSLSLERAPSAASVLSDKIDSAWAGPLKSLDEPQNPNPITHRSQLTSPTRVYSFDSAIRQQERNKKGLLPSSFYLSTLKSFHASGDYLHMVRDPVHSLQRRSYSQAFPIDDFSITRQSLILSTPFLPEGARLMIPNGGQTTLVISVYDNEPTSIIAYALSSKEHEDWITDRVNQNQNQNQNLNLNLSRNSSTAWQSLGSVDLDYNHFGQEEAIGPLFNNDRKTSNHVKIPFEDDSGVDGKVKFSVTCYFAKNFDALRQKCCPNELDYVRSLSRCKRWSAQGGKSNVYFAKSLDERFIIKQVTKTELESFEEFAPEYFKYLMDSLNSGSPTCLAKIMGIYQVTVKHLRAGKEAKMNVLVMENVFFKRNISRIYDLKGSSRSRYNSDTTGTNKTLLDMNLLEALRTNPIFLGSKAKRKLERAVWNDTSFLASIDVIDYSLLVGVDEEKKQLVLGIIDFMRQYTWDKHLETWVKASGILGGPKNAAPTIISPKQYKKRFRKAMTSYFLAVPDQWSSVCSKSNSVGTGSKIDHNGFFGFRVAHRRDDNRDEVRSQKVRWCQVGEKKREK
ncbi:hypothetical protein LXL04_021254 [Taraxacum kok-saghyz]